MRGLVPNKPPTLTPKGVEQSREARVSEAGAGGEGTGRLTDRSKIAEGRGRRVSPRSLSVLPPA